jgi:hypothetical protein
LEKKAKTDSDLQKRFICGIKYSTQIFLYQRNLLQ